MRTRRALIQTSWILATLTALCLSALITPGFFHVHVDGDAPHEHGPLNHHSHQHTRSHSHGHSHRHGHRHTHSHVSASGKERVATTSSAVEHVHLSFLGWQLTIVLPGRSALVSGVSTPAVRTTPAGSDFAVPSKFASLRHAAKEPAWRMGNDWIVGTTGADWSFMASPLPPPITIPDLETDDSAATIQNPYPGRLRSAPPTPPPRLPTC